VPFNYFSCVCRGFADESLDKYEKNYSTNGITTNLNAWQKNKGWLVELLRRHPNWDEDSLAIIFQVSHSREIDRSVVNGCKYSLVDLISEIDITQDDRVNLIHSLDTVTHSYTSKLPNEATATNIKNYSGVTCVAGQKSSRVINTICKKYGLDKHSEYNARFARLADALSPLQIKRTALLSVHPCDYLEMSNRDNSWSSCHALSGGEYQGGVLSYMNDGCSMIFYTVDNGVTEDYYTSPKRTRQVFCFDGGILLQSRLYPQSDDNDTRSMYRNIVQAALADCMHVPNLWTLKRDHDVVKLHIKSHPNSLHYPDYDYKQFHPTISLIDGVNLGDDYLVVGETACCVSCADPIEESKHLYCDSYADDGDGYVYCNDCDDHIHQEDATCVDGNWYCSDCYSFCDHCNEYVRSETTQVYNASGYRIHVCTNCRDDHYYYCEGCDWYHYDTTGKDTPDGFRCDDCIEKEYKSCACCDEIVHKDDAVTVGDENYCENCAADVSIDNEETYADTMADTEYLVSA